MKQISTILLLIGLFSGLLFPDFNALLKPISARGDFSNSDVIFTPVPINVVKSTTPSRPVISVTSNPQTAGDCKAAISPLADMPQSAGILNLSQPASCFRLSVGQPKISLNDLSVAALAPQPAIVVVNIVPKISAPNLASSSGPGLSFPLLPVGFVLTVAVVFAKPRKILKHVIVLRESNFTALVSLQQLQMMRC